MSTHLEPGFDEHRQEEPLLRIDPGVFTEIARYQGPIPPIERLLSLGILDVSLLVDSVVEYTEFEQEIDSPSVGSSCQRTTPTPVSPGPNADDLSGGHQCPDPEFVLRSHS